MIKIQKFQKKWLKKQKDWFIIAVPLNRGIPTNPFLYSSPSVAGRMEWK